MLVWSHRVALCPASGTTANGDATDEKSRRATADPHLDRLQVRRLTFQSRSPPASVPVFPTLCCSKGYGEERLSKTSFVEMPKAGMENVVSPICSYN